MKLKGTKTAENLLKSFAGESQARNRYTFYSSVAKKEGFVQISKIFLETAEQEREHAKAFFKFLKDEFADEMLEINAAYPIALHDQTLKNLKAAAAGEHGEWSHDYPEFARIAREEGFEDIAFAYEKITEVEKTHEEKYLKLAANIENDKVFKKDTKVAWRCLNCGYIYEGLEAPKICPACRHPQGYFEVWVENY